jgi:hypothetical protein
MINDHLLNEDIESYFMTKKTYPYCLLQLSDKQVFDLKENSIHVTDLSYNNKKVTYSTIKYAGSNIKKKGKNVTLMGKLCSWSV